MKFADLNMIARSGDGRRTAENVQSRFKDGRKYRDLTLRLDMPTIGETLGKDKLLPQGTSVVNVLKRATFTQIDADAIETLQARMNRQAEQWAAAAKHYFNLVTRAEWPAYRYGFLHRGADCLEKAASGGYAAALEAYIRRIPQVQELVPDVLYLIGRYHVRKRQPAVLKIRNRLQREYPDSFALSRLQQEIARLQERMQNK
jgi:hypothetical protein